jgi:hypothetical protein
MEWNGKRIVGRHVVDIDGCLRTTDLAAVRIADIAEIHGSMPAGTSFVMERNGEIIPLDGGDRVTLDESCVTFFRSIRPRPHFFALPLDASFSEPRALAA